MKAILKGYQKIGTILKLVKEKDDVEEAECQWKPITSLQLKIAEFFVNVGYRDFKFTYECKQGDNGEEETCLECDTNLCHDMYCAELVLFTYIAKNLNGGRICFDDGVVTEISPVNPQIEHKLIGQYYDNPVKMTWVLIHNTSGGAYQPSRFDSREDAIKWMRRCALNNITEKYCPLANFEFIVDVNNLSEEQIDAAFSLVSSVFTIVGGSSNSGMLYIYYDFIDNESGEEKKVYDEFIVYNI